jgi:hypothetical protein
LLKNRKKRLTEGEPSRGEGLLSDVYALKKRDLKTRGRERKRHTFRPSSSSGSSERAAEAKRSGQREGRAESECPCLKSSVAGILLVYCFVVMKLNEQRGEDDDEDWERGERILCARCCLINILTEKTHPSIFSCLHSVVDSQTGII